MGFHHAGRRLQRGDIDLDVEFERSAPKNTRIPGIPAHPEEEIASIREWRVASSGPARRYWMLPAWFSAPADSPKAASYWPKFCWRMLKSALPAAG